MYDVSWVFLLMWFFGEVLMFVYVFYHNVSTGVWQLPLLTNYVANFVMLCYLLYAKSVYGGVK